VTRAKQIVDGALRMAGLMSCFSSCWPVEVSNSWRLHEVLMTEGTPAKPSQKRHAIAMASSRNVRTMTGNSLKDVV
jgi:hypothetical protein